MTPPNPTRVTSNLRAEPARGPPDSISGSSSRIPIGWQERLEIGTKTPRLSQGRGPSASEGRCDNEEADAVGKDLGKEEEGADATGLEHTTHRTRWRLTYSGTGPSPRHRHD